MPMAHTPSRKETFSQKEQQTRDPRSIRWDIAILSGSQWIKEPVLFIGAKSAPTLTGLIQRVGLPVRMKLDRHVLPEILVGPILLATTKHIINMILLRTKVFPCGMLRSH